MQSWAPFLVLVVVVVVVVVGIVRQCSPEVRGDFAAAAKRKFKFELSAPPGKRAFELWSATAGLDSEEELPDAAEDLEPTFGKL